MPTIIYCKDGIQSIKHYVDYNPILEQLIAWSIAVREHLSHSDSMLITINSLHGRFSKAVLYIRNVGSGHVVLEVKHIEDKSNIQPVSADMFIPIEEAIGISRRFF